MRHPEVTETIQKNVSKTDMPVYDVCALRFTLHCFLLCLQQCLHTNTTKSFDTSFLIQIVFVIFFSFQQITRLSHFFLFQIQKVLLNCIYLYLNFLVFEQNATLFFFFKFYRFSLGAQSSLLIVLFTCISVSKSLWSSQVINHQIDCDVIKKTGQGALDFRLQTQ